ncbi:hypothetical protein [Gordonia sihwensis]|uniref:hypothetical protein n=1 Tax=Gordonia sihwensis TaxID=173559 RepID=UPI0005EEC76B|nr:hypothetical protein [Gordonia sihwensis]KJR10558.1 hypothetical protein UG54_00790 [Gordonia sihwensis]
MTATTNALIDSLDTAIEAKLAAELAITTTAARALASIMEERGWTEVQVDVEELSRIEQVTLVDGTVVDIDLDEEEQADYAVGNCARGLFHYRRGEHRVTLDEVRQAIAA